MSDHKFASKDEYYSSVIRELRAEIKTLKEVNKLQCRDLDDAQRSLEDKHADNVRLQAQLDEANEKLRWHLISESLPDTGLLLVADSEDWSSIEYRWFDDELELPAWINCWMYAENLVPEGGIVIPTSEVKKL